MNKSELLAECKYKFNNCELSTAIYKGDWERWETFLSSAIDRLVESVPSAGSRVNNWKREVLK